MKRIICLIFLLTIPLLIVLPADLINHPETGETGFFITREEMIKVLISREELEEYKRQDVEDHADYKNAFKLNQDLQREVRHYAAVNKLLIGSTVTLGIIVIVESLVLFIGGK